GTCVVIDLRDAGSTLECGDLSPLGPKADGKHTPWQFDRGGHNHGQTYRGLGRNRIVSERRCSRERTPCFFLSSNSKSSDRTKQSEGNDHDSGANVWTTH